jgi:hypothetical protein
MIIFIKCRSFPIGNTHQGRLSRSLTSDWARRKASRNALAAVAKRRLEPVCLSEKVGFDFFSIDQL